MATEMRGKAMARSNNKSPYNLICECTNYGGGATFIG